LENVVGRFGNHQHRQTIQIRTLSRLVCPYEIKFKSGKSKKFNLAVRNDNPAKRWMVDGGF